MNESEGKVTSRIGTWIVTGTLAAVALLIVVAAVFERETSKPPALTRVQLERAFSATALLQQAAAALAVERGLVYYALHAPAPALEDLRATIAERRSLSETALAGAVVAASDVLPNSPQNLYGFRLTKRDLEALRAMVDQDLATLPSQRERGLPLRWFTIATQRIKALERLLVAVHRQIARADPGVRNTLHLQQYAWRLGDIAGRERALLSAAAVLGRPLPRREQERLGRYQKRLHSHWRMAEAMVRSERVPAQVLTEFEKVRQSFLKQLEEPGVGMHHASVEGGNYPLSAPAWFDTSTRAIESIWQLNHTAGETARASAIAHAPASS